MKLKTLILSPPLPCMHPLFWRFLILRNYDFELTRIQKQESSRDQQEDYNYPDNELPLHNRLPRIAGSRFHRSPYKPRSELVQRWRTDKSMADQTLRRIDNSPSILPIHRN